MELEFQNQYDATVKLTRYKLYEEAVQESRPAIATRVRFTHAFIGQRPGVRLIDATPGKVADIFRLLGTVYTRSNYMDVVTDPNFFEVILDLIQDKAKRVSVDQPFIDFKSVRDKCPTPCYYYVVCCILNEFSMLVKHPTVYEEGLSPTVHNQFDRYIFDTTVPTIEKPVIVQEALQKTDEDTTAGNILRRTKKSYWYVTALEMPVVNLLNRLKNALTGATTAEKAMWVVQTVFQSIVYRSELVEQYDLDQYADVFNTYHPELFSNPNPSIIIPDSSYIDRCIRMYTKVLAPFSVPYAAIYARYKSVSFEGPNGVCAFKLWRDMEIPKKVSYFPSTRAGYYFYSSFDERNDFYERLQVHLPDPSTTKDMLNADSSAFLLNMREISHVDFDAIANEEVYFSTTESGRIYRAAPFQQLATGRVLDSTDDIYATDPRITVALRFMSRGQTDYPAYENFFDYPPPQVWTTRFPVSTIEGKLTIVVPGSADTIDITRLHTGALGGDVFRVASEANVYYARAVEWEGYEVEVMNYNPHLLKLAIETMRRLPSFGNDRPYDEKVRMVSELLTGIFNLSSTKDVDFSNWDFTRSVEIVDPERIAGKTGKFHRTITIAGKEGGNEG